MSLSRFGSGLVSGFVGVGDLVRDGGVVHESGVRGILMSRDVQAVQIILEMGVLTVEQAYRLVWWKAGSKGSRYAEERMVFLERAGFITRVQTPYSKKAFFKGTRQGLGLVQSEAPDFCLTSLAQVSVSEIPHTDGLCNLRAAIKVSGRFKDESRYWRSDRELRVDPNFPKERMWDAIPDAVWTTKSGRRIAIEYERTRKGGPRLLAKIQRLDLELTRGDAAFDLVLWVSSPGALPDLKRVLNGRPKHELRVLSEMTAELLNAHEGVKNGIKQEQSV